MTQAVPTPPVVKQNVTIGDWLFGAVAVAAGTNRWGVMTVDNGGHWSTDKDVDGWATLPQQVAVEPAPEAAPEVPESVAPVEAAPTA